MIHIFLQIWNLPNCTVFCKWKCKLLYYLKITYRTYERFLKKVYVLFWLASCQEVLADQTHCSVHHFHNAAKKNKSQQLPTVKKKISLKNTYSTVQYRRWVDFWRKNYFECDYPWNVFVFMQNYWKMDENNVWSHCWLEERSWPFCKVPKAVS
jgi:hypothetical protein